MSTLIIRSGRALAAGVLLVCAAGATLIPSLSFEQLIDASELIVSGRVTSSWSAWDAEHKYIWTHYNLSVASALKGSPASIVEFAEPGGALEGYAMNIAGSVRYSAGDNMVVFLSRMPNGYLRTAGWAQGKYALDSGGRLHASASLGAEIVDTGSRASLSSLRTLEGMRLTELAQRVSARVRAVQGKVQ